MLRLSSLVLLLCLLAPRDAWAYIDVGAGSLLLQAVLASLLAVGYGVKMRWRQIRASLARLLKREPERKEP